METKKEELTFHLERVKQALSTLDEVLEDRNMTSHTYDQYIADKVYESAKRLPHELKQAIARISEM